MVKKMTKHCFKIEEILISFSHWKIPRYTIDIVPKNKTFIIKAGLEWEVVLSSLWYFNVTFDIDDGSKFDNQMINKNK